MRDITDFYERSYILLASQFRKALQGTERTNIQKLIASLVKPFYDINSVQLQLYYDRFLATAVGVQLDNIGIILGLPRGIDSQTNLLQSDDQYRESLYFQTFINASTGTPEEAIAALKFLTKGNLIEYFEPYPAFYQMFTNGRPQDFIGSPQDIMQAISDMSPAGVQYVPITWNYEYEWIFAFSSDPVVSNFYVAPDPDDLEQHNPFHVSTDGMNDLPFQVNTGQTVEDPAVGSFAEDDFFVEEAGELAEVIVINGGQPPL